MKIKIAIADDHDMFRDGVNMIISEEENMEVTGSFKNGQEITSFLEKESPDIVLMDISMPVMDGIEATKLAMERNPNLKIIVLSMFDDEEYYHQMIELGVKGFVLKKSGSGDLLAAIRRVNMGEQYFSQELLQKIIMGFNNQNETKIELTDREKEVLLLTCNGFTNQEISEKLFTSPKTIEHDKSSLMQKTNTKNSAHLVMFAIQNKLIEF